MNRQYCSITTAGLFLLAFLALTVSLSAQVGTEGVILGVVKDASGAVVAGAEVTATNLDTNLKRSATTDSGGNFEIRGLPRGSYSVTASFTGVVTPPIDQEPVAVVIPAPAPAAASCR